MSNGDFNYSRVFYVWEAPVLGLFYPFGQIALESI